MYANLEVVVRYSANERKIYAAYEVQRRDGVVTIWLDANDDGGYFEHAGCVTVPADVDIDIRASF